MLHNSSELERLDAADFVNESLRLLRMSVDVQVWKEFGDHLDRATLQDLWKLLKLWPHIMALLEPNCSTNRGSNKTDRSRQQLWSNPDHNLSVWITFSDLSVVHEALAGLHSFDCETNDLYSDVAKHLNLRLFVHIFSTTIDRMGGCNSHSSWLAALTWFAGHLYSVLWSANLRCCSI